MTKKDASLKVVPVTAISFASDPKALVIALIVTPRESLAIVVTTMVIAVIVIVTIIVITAVIIIVAVIATIFNIIAGIVLITIESEVVRVAVQV